MPAFLRTDSDNLAHLLVGPYSDPQTMAKVKADLESRFGLHPMRK
jgi:cell division septation protein DedD